MTKLIIAYVLTLLFWTPIAQAADGSILVFGGTGQLGSEIVKDLIEAGEEFDVFVRPTSDRSRLDGLDVSYVVGDMLSPADIERVFTEASYRAVVDASGIARGADPNFYIESQKLISNWSKETGVGQIILHGAIGAGDSGEMFIFENVPEMQRRSIAAKTIAETILTESGVPYAIIRNMTLLPLETRESGNAKLTRDHGTIGPVTRDGLARLTMECLDNTDCINEIFHATDLEAELTGRYENAWTGYERIFKPGIVEAQRP